MAELLLGTSDLLDYTGVSHDPCLSGRKPRNRGLRLSSGKVGGTGESRKSQPPPRRIGPRGTGNRARKERAGKGRAREPGGVSPSRPLGGQTSGQVNGAGEGVKAPGRPREGRPGNPPLSLPAGRADRRVGGAGPPSPASNQNGASCSPAGRRCRGGGRTTRGRAPRPIAVRTGRRGRTQGPGRTDGLLGGRRPGAQDTNHASFSRRLQGSAPFPTSQPGPSSPGLMPTSFHLQPLLERPGASRRGKLAPDGHFLCGGKGGGGRTAAAQPGPGGQTAGSRAGSGVRGRQGES
ncbi:translation initiation factor IF-2-like [Mustela erminea]|uniref:translation initiation factor IF-2-like n=1 Tax=Mustela erminea TaxID=36723 RepID=UPI00138732B1|nr:translation initiation factor IF-2-like [Mustela erminea]